MEGEKIVQHILVPLVASGKSIKSIPVLYTRG